MKRLYRVSRDRIAALARKHFARLEDDRLHCAPHQHAGAGNSSIDIRDIADAVTRAQAGFGAPTEQDRLDALAPDDNDRRDAHRAAQERTELINTGDTPRAYAHP